MYAATGDETALREGHFPRLARIYGHRSTPMTEYCIGLDVDRAHGGIAAFDRALESPGPEMGRIRATGLTEEGILL